MNIDVEFHIRHNYPWSKLPANVRQVRPRPGAGAPPRRHLLAWLWGPGPGPLGSFPPSARQGLGETDPHPEDEEGTALGPRRGRTGSLLKGMERSRTLDSPGAFA